MSLGREAQDEIAINSAGREGRKMSEVEFPSGLMVKKPNDQAPDFVKCGISIKRRELIDWLNSRQGEWINLQVKESREGKWYASVDNWKPQSQAEQAKAAIREPGSDDDAPAMASQDEFDSEIPF